jgi:hypothetical protein
MLFIKAIISHKSILSNHYYLGLKDGKINAMIFLLMLLVASVLEQGLV